MLLFSRVAIKSSPLVTLFTSLFSSHTFRSLFSFTFLYSSFFTHFESSISFLSPSSIRFHCPQRGTRFFKLTHKFLLFAPSLVFPPPAGFPHLCDNDGRSPWRPKTAPTGRTSGHDPDGLTLLSRVGLQPNGVRVTIGKTVP